MRRLAALGLSVSALLASIGCGSHAAPAALPPPSDGRAVFSVEVGGDGYHPGEISAPPSTPIRLVFTRTTDEGCGQELVIPSLDVHRDLPLNEQVAVDLVTPASGRLAFTCGMGMYQGAVVAAP
jgi:plastocyanin domain-containing protein